MLDALPVTVRFCCPTCGTGFRASRATGGTVLSCHGCGEQIRVPRQQHPIECSGEESPFLTPTVAAEARSGIRLLMIGVSLVVVQLASILTAYAIWIWSVGPAQMIERDPGNLGRVLLAVWLFDLVLVTAQTVVKWLGYQRCETMAAAIDSSGWVTASRYAVLMRAIGYSIACVPWVLALPSADTTPLLKALVQIGHLTWIVGIVFEFGILFVWFRVLSELGGPNLTRSVTRFLFATAASLVIGAVAVSLTAISLVMLLRRNGQATSVPGSPDPHFNYDAIPNDGWYTIATLGVMLVSLALFMLCQYARILATTRNGLAPLTQPTSGE